MEKAMALDPARESRLAMIQMLVLLGLKHVAEELNCELEELAF